MKRLVPPAVLAKAKDDLFIRHYWYGYNRLLKFLAKQGYPVISTAEIQAEIRRRRLNPRTFLSRHGQKA